MADNNNTRAAELPLTPHPGLRRLEHLVGTWRNGSSNYFRGRLSADGRKISGRWQWPGGGFDTVSTRIA